MNYAANPKIKAVFFMRKNINLFFKCGKLMI